MKKLFLIDASGYIYRSYHAIPSMTNSQGESTNALFGFIRSLTKLRKDFNPEYLVSIFDGPKGAAKREELYAEYKAHRVEMPKDLDYQINWAKEACDLLGISSLSVPGVEADDTLGSIAVWAEQNGVTVYLCTSDKDLCQLVSDHVFVLNTFKDNLIIGPNEVQEIYGVTPKQMVDLLAMTGDASDNVPGLPGIGFKTAAALLQEHHSLEFILDHPELLKGKKQEIVRQYGDQARLSKQLVTIHTEVEFPKEESFFKIRDPDIAALKKFYASMNFSSLLKELDALPSKGPEAEPQHEIQGTYTLINDVTAFATLMEEFKCCPEIAISTIGTHEQPFKAEFVGIAFGIDGNKGFYIPANGNIDKNTLRAGLQELLSHPHIAFFGHDIKYDLQLLKQEGIDIGSISFDTMLASYILNLHSRQHSLGQLVLDVFGKVKTTVHDLIGKGKKAISIKDVKLEDMSAYACKDAHYVYLLKAILRKQLEERNLIHILQEIELPLLRSLASMERHGIFLDTDCLKQMSIKVKSSLDQLEKDIYALAGEEFNINSPKQLGDILFGKLGIHAPKKTATGLSTNAEVLEFLQEDYPIAGKILEYRTLEKLRSTYIDCLPAEIDPKTQRIHCTFNQSVAATGRLSCQNPNLQNIPIRSEVGRAIRNAFRPQKEGWSYLAADYSQIELRLLAHLSEDPILIETFEKGGDIHASTAAYIFGIPVEQVTKEQRYAAKAVNFGIVYGQQGYGLAQELGIEVKEASDYINAYFKRYHKVKSFLDQNKENARRTGRAVTMTGRERLIPEINSKNGMIRNAAERLAINTPLQGTAADLIKLAMLDIDHKLQATSKKGYMILQIHDELIFEVPDYEVEELGKLVRDSMENVFNLKVPLIVDITIGKNWAQC